MKKLTVIVNLFILFLVLTVVYKWANVVLLFVLMNKRTYISLIFILAIISSCQESIDPSTLEFEKKMVLHCLFNPGETWRLKLETSWNIVDPDDSSAFIEGAEIILMDANDRSLGPFNYRGNGIYEIPNEYPDLGMSYRIEIQHPDYPSLFAESQVPELFEIEDFREMEYECQEQDCRAYAFTFESFSTSPSKVIVENHLTRLYLNNLNDTITLEEMDLMAHHPESSNADVFLEETTYSTQLLYGDVQHNSEIAFLSLNGFRKEDEVFLVKGEANVIVERCSEAFYQYRKSYEIYELSKTKFVSSLLPPVEIFSNVDGGLGIFAGSHQVGVGYVF